MKFSDDQKRWLLSEGVPHSIIHYWEKGGGIRKRYARIVAKVLGVRDAIDLIDPPKKVESGTEV